MSYLSKVFYVFERDEKLKIGLIFLFSIISVLFEMLGITMILPVLSILIEGNLNNNYFKFLDFLFDFFKNFNTENLLLLVLTALVVVFLVKNFFLFLFNYFNFKIVNNISARLSSSVFNKYLNNDYNFHLKSNSTILINNCITVIDAFKDTLLSILVFLTEIFILIGILLILLIFEPKGFLLCLMFIFALGLITFISSNRILINWGRDAIKANEKRFLFLTQAFDAIREIKVFNNKDFFVKKYLIPNKNKYRISTLISTANAIPKYLLEIIFVISLSILLFFLDYINYDKNKIIVIMGLFSVATIRIIPSLNKIFTSFQTIKFGHHAIEKVYEEFLLNKDQETKKKDLNKNLKSINAESLISFENVSFKYEDKDNEALKDINFKILDKEILVIMGKSGSGKTTLINLILGLLKPSKGKVVSNFSSPSFVSQTPYLLDDSIKNNIALGVNEDEIDSDIVKSCLEKVQLKEFVNSQSKGIDTIIGEKGIRISGGEIQRLALARALYVNPDIIILDEPTSSLDKTTESKILNILKELSTKQTIIIVTHNLDNLNYCDRVIELQNNRIKFKDKTDR